MREPFPEQCPECDHDYHIAYGKTASGYSGYYIDSRTCDDECVLTDDDLVTAYENEMERRQEQQYADYHGGNGPFNDAERREVAQRQRDW